MLDGTIWVFLAEVLALPTGLLTAAFLTRRLGLQGYGLLTLASALVVWIEWSITAVFARATIKLVGEAEDWRPIGTTVLRLHLGVSIGAALCLWWCAAPLATLLNEPVLSTYLRLFALDLPLFSLAHAHRHLLIGIGAFRQRALASASRWIARLFFIVILVELGLSVPGAILGSMGASLVELIMARCTVRPSLFHRSNVSVQRLFDHAAPLFLFALSMRLYDKLDVFMLKVLGSTAEQVGIYGAAQQLSLVPSIFALSFSPLLLSTLSRILHMGHDGRAKAMGCNAMRLVIGLIPFAGMTAGASSELVQVIFGPEFFPSARLLSLLIFSSLALVMISVATVILTAAGKPTWTFVLTGPLLPLALVGHLVLIPWLGTLGAALTTMLCASFGALAAVLAVYRIWRILPPLGTLSRSALGCGVVYGLAILWPASGVVLCVKLVMLSLVIGIVFLLLGECSTSEMRRVRTMLRWPTVRKPSPEASWTKTPTKIPGAASLQTPGSAHPTLSVIVPVYNATDDLKRCLDALAASQYNDFDVLVVDDGSTEPVESLVRQHGFGYLRLDGPGGPARARNRGVACVRGRYVVFIDADVCVHHDTLARFAARFAGDPTIDAVVGAYDDAPAAPQFLSQYKNLLHHYVHQRFDGEIRTFWSGCGAMRRELFMAFGGFNEQRYRRPAIEDIELGTLVSAARHRIVLDSRIKGKHLKRWTLWNLLKTDIFDRGIPWVRLMLRTGVITNSLNTESRQRCSIALAYVTVLSTLVAVWWPLAWIGVALLAGAVTRLNRDFYRYLVARRGLWFTVRVIPLHWLYFGYCGGCVVWGILSHYLTGDAAAASKTA
jgi:O-antigen/teichoic acid export membrane protein/glycosyltransferase involved in cell wall biosynthesis